MSEGNKGKKKQTRKAG